jgi:hypothetical protein
MWPGILVVRFRKYEFLHAAGRGLQFMFWSLDTPEEFVFDKSISVFVIKSNCTARKGKKFKLPIVLVN